MAGTDDGVAAAGTGQGFPAGTHMNVYDYHLVFNSVCD